MQFTASSICGRSREISNCCQVAFIVFFLRTLHRDWIQAGKWHSMCIAHNLLIMNRSKTSVLALSFHSASELPNFLNYITKNNFVQNLHSSLIRTLSSSSSLNNILMSTEGIVFVEWTSDRVCEVLHLSDTLCVKDLMSILTKFCSSVVLEDSYLAVKLVISGMTCQSCASAVKRTLLALQGVYKVKVVVEEKCAYVAYNINHIDVLQMVQSIEEAGFSIVKTNISNLEHLFPSVKECNLNVVGMTCKSCEMNLSKALLSRLPLLKATFNAVTNSGIVLYDAQRCTAHQIIDAINDMGYEASISTEESSTRKGAREEDSFEVDYLGIGSSRKSLNVKKNKFENNIISKRKLSSSTAVHIDMQKLQARMFVGDGQQQEFERCTLAIEGMTCASCVANIERNLMNVDGISKVLVSLIAGKADVTYDATVILPSQIVNFVEDMGFACKLMEESTATKRKLELMIVGMTCTSCVHQIERNVKNLRGVVDAEVTLTNSSGVFIYEPNQCTPRSIMKCIEDLGYSCSLLSKENRSAALSHNHDISRWKKSFLISLLFGLPVMAVMVYYHWILHTMDKPENQWHVIPGLSFDNLLLFLLCTPIQFLGGRYFYVKSYKAFKHCTANMDVLIVLATTISYIYSVIVLIAAVLSKWSISPMTFFDVPPMLLMFISLGRWLESIAKAKTSEVLSKLMTLQAKDATIVQLGNNNEILSEASIDLELVQIGDYLKVVPGAKIPVDGKVIFGSSSADESYITGEPLPVTKAPGSTVIGGSVNLNGNLIIEATHAIQDSTLAQIVKLVEEAQTSKAPIQHLADKIASYFVPGVILIASLTWIVWLIIGFIDVDIIRNSFGGHCMFLEPVHQNHSVHSSDAHADYIQNLELIFKFAFDCAITVLAIACPCSLGLATPTAVMVGTGVGAKNGILIKGGEPLELAHKITTIIFDKTGTVTQGKPKLTKICLFVNEIDISLHYLLAIIGTAESNSEHPIAEAITAHVKQFLKTERFGVCKLFQTSPGHGVRCIVSDVEMMMQKSEKLAEKGNVSFLNDVEVVNYNFGLPPSSCNEQILVNTGNNMIIFLNDYYEIMQIHDHSKEESSNREWEVLIGNRKWLDKHGIQITNEVDGVMSSEEQMGRIAVLVAINGKVVSVFSVADCIKAESALAVYSLQKMGLKTILLTGDNCRTAAATAKQIGISVVFAEVLPNHKKIKVEQLQRRNEVVAMVGDGINDSPALAAADVGIAIAAGADVAIESASIVLIKNNLLDVVAAIDLSQKTTRRIWINFLFASIYNLLSIPVAAGAFRTIGFGLQPWMAAAAMALSSVSVVTSSLMLKLYNKPTVESLTTADFANHISRLRSAHYGSIEVHRGLEEFKPRKKRSPSASIQSKILSLIRSVDQNNTSHTCEPTLQQGLLSSDSMDDDMQI
ncbi:Copper-transporting ATPase 1 [Trichinella nativa]|uniref:P-type Cu(+) transporter n=1 Tax=Trichinella nativa TaxID=6335 RepID=A0A0V1LIR8_9BILA|nr:Copper-transporting ATPase 1 [Trichinella nativa]